MVTLMLLVEHVDVTAERISVELSDGRSISAPVAWFPRLAAGNDLERRKWQKSAGGTGIHWPTLDEDISVEGLLRGARGANAPHDSPSEASPADSLEVHLSAERRAIIAELEEALTRADLLGDHLLAAKIDAALCLAREQFAGSNPGRSPA